MIASPQLGVADVDCPHPQELERHRIIVRGRRQTMALCMRTCYPMFRQLVDRWDRHAIAPADVVATMLRNGYTRRNAAGFLLELAARRVRARLGFAVEAV